MHKHIGHLSSHCQANAEIFFIAQAKCIISTDVLSYSTLTLCTALTQDEQIIGTDA